MMVPTMRLIFSRCAVSTRIAVLRPTRYSGMFRPGVSHPPGAVMKPNQVHPVRLGVSRDSQQIVHAANPDSRPFVRDVAMAIGRNRIHDDVAFVHLVTTAHFYVWTRPDTMLHLISRAGFPREGVW